MNVPKYVQELMKRSNFALGYGSAGYTLEVHKETDRTMVGTLAAEVTRLEKWVEKQMPEDELNLGVPTAVVNCIPKKTHYCDQYAVITIYDPVMKELEKFIAGDAAERRNL